MTIQPTHQRIIKIVTALIGGLLALGAFLDSISNAIVLITPRITYVSSALLIVSGVSIHLFLRQRPLLWVMNGQAIRIQGLRLIPIAVIAGMICLLWIPRFVSTGSGERQETEAPTNANVPRLTNWPDLLQRGEALTLEVLTIPRSLQNSLLIAGQHYRVQFVAERCEWILFGPIQHPSEGVVGKHTNRASPYLRGRLTRDESETQVGACNLPREYRMVAMIYELRFDANGIVYYGSEQLGHLRGAV